MQTRCPYSDCLHVFLQPEGRSGTCEQCGRPMTFRPVKVLMELERKWEFTEYTSISPASCAEKSESAAPSAQQIVVIVEDIRSLFNVGSIFRSADGAGIRHIYLCGITGTPPRKEIAKVSLGAEDVLPWSFSLSALSVISKLRGQGYFVLALERNATSVDLKQALMEQKIRYPLCLIVGNEVTGVSAEVLPQCDLVCHLPMRGVKESLNVSVAFGIAAYMLAQ